MIFYLYYIFINPMSFSKFLKCIIQGKYYEANEFDLFQDKIFVDMIKLDTRENTF